MDKKIIRICTLCIVPVMAVSLAGCKKTVGENSGYILLDADECPSVTAPYEEESKAAIADYIAVAEKHLTTEGEINSVDRENAQVQSAATDAAIKLYAYACYNEEYLDKYVCFSEQTGTTTSNSINSQATKQDYKLIIHESEDVCGYKYHYTIKKVDSVSGWLSSFQSLFESCKLRFVEKETNNLYRFNGSNVNYDDEGYLTCTWNIDTSQKYGWGSSEDEPAIVKRSGGKLDYDGIKQDAVYLAVNEPSESVLHGNINIFADDVISAANIFKLESDGGDTIYRVWINFDIDKVNADSASLNMLRAANDSSEDDDDPICWSGDSLAIVFQIWENGLFYSYNMAETWKGSISAGITSFSGTVTSKTSVTYSYSDRDTDLTEKLEMLESAKQTYNG